MPSMFIEQTLPFEEGASVSATTFIYMDFLARKNKDIYEHSKQVANYAKSIATQLRLTAAEIAIVESAALLHDLGKLAIPNEIIRRYPTLYAREMSVYKRHCDLGANMLENEPGFQSIARYIRYHHEKWDGKGYPRRLKGVNIPLESRIISVANYYESINPCTRNWPKSAKKACLEISGKAGADFDPDVVRAFINTLGN